MSQSRRKIDKHTKARVAIEAIRDEKTTAQIVSKYEVKSGQVSIWKKQLLEVAPDIFEDKRSKKVRDNDLEKREDELYRQIGKLQFELEFLKKKSRQLEL